RPPQQPQGRTDRLGDPLPPGAVARLGSIRFHHESPVAFSPDGKILATGSRLREVASGRQLHLLEDYPFGIEQLAFSPDGKLLAGLSHSGGTPALSGGTLTLWEAASGERRLRLKVHKDGASYFVFSPDGKLLATADRPYNDPDKKYLVRLWDVAAGRE